MRVSIVLLLISCALAKVQGSLPSDQTYNDNQNHFITNGLRATRQQFPYQAAILIETFGAQNAFCGGSLIAEEWVLTAAHCVHMMKNFTVILGAYHLADQNETNRQVFAVDADNAMVHENWDMRRVRNDIALLRLPTKAVLNENVQIVKIPSRRDSISLERPGSFVTVSGWGKESDRSTSVSDYLQYINQPLITNFRCSFYYFFQIRQGHICASGARRMSPCQGDSGGPLVSYENGDATQVGVVSFGILFGCEKGWPAVFTRISNYLDFIEETTGLNVD